MLGSSIADADSLVLFSCGAPVDAVCYYYDPTTTWEFSDPLYTCAGTPVYNPHDGTSSTYADKSIARSPGGAAGNCTGTENNADDFILEMKSTPENLASLPN